MYKSATPVPLFNQTSAYKRVLLLQEQNKYSKSFLPKKKWISTFSKWLLKIPPLIKLVLTAIFIARILPSYPFHSNYLIYIWKQRA
jgi:hypothetical protein